MNILVTGCAGFIGFHLCDKLLSETKYKIYGIDNLNNYYNVKLKKNRLAILKKNKSFKFYTFDLSDYIKTLKNFKYHKYDIVVHLAAQAGVRYSIKNPSNYVKDNLNAFFSILDSSRLLKVKHLLIASTSSVYGDSKKFPITEDRDTNHPLSFYAATKKSNELMAYSYSNIYKLPCTVLRFFTVYGPYGRPDMSLFKFTKAIISSKKIDLYNRGDHIRDFTYIDDAVKYISKLINKPSKNKIPYNCFNIGSDKPQRLKYFLNHIEKNLNKKSQYNLLPLQQGDVYKTHADINLIKKYLSIKSNTDIKVGIKNFINWYKQYYKV